MMYCIKAEMQCDTEMVRRVFDDRFLNSVYVIKEERIDADFKRFWIYLDMGRKCSLEETFLQEIHEHGFARVYYDERCWNVTLG